MGTDSLKLHLFSAVLEVVYSGQEDEAVIEHFIIMLSAVR